MRRAAPLTLLAALAAPLPAQDATWRDPSPHTVRFVEANGVRLHVLDWGGTGALVVLLPGYGMTAHVYDDVAPLLVKSGYHAVAITPRGFGESSASDSAAYTIAAATDDLRAVLDSLRTGRVALVAHSFSGQVITLFAARHPARVAKLVYLDAFPNYTALRGDAVGDREPVQPPPFTGDTTIANIRAWLVRTIHGTWTPALEADLHAKPGGVEGARRRSLFSRFLEDQALHSSDLTQVAAPALQMCAVTSTAARYPWLTAGAPEFARADHYDRATERPFWRRACADFARQVQRGTTVDFPGGHYVFFYEAAKTARIIARFLN
ncbi:MAG: alpha/beta hydrolase [Gemmatimonadaceae bacterium]